MESLKFAFERFVFSNILSSKLDFEKLHSLKSASIKSLEAILHLINLVFGILSPAKLQLCMRDLLNSKSIINLSHLVKSTPTILQSINLTPLIFE